MNNTEQIYNLYYYVNLNIITEVGVVVHEKAGTDEEKMQFLKNNFERDFSNVKMFEIPDSFKLRQYGIVKKGIDHASYRDLCNQGHDLLIYENIFREYGAPASPLVLSTPVCDGKIKIEGVQDLKAATEPIPEYVYIKKPDEWYVGYIDDQGFHFDRLINDDFFDAIRVTFNSQHYVSAMKLLMICIDTLSFLEYGDIPKNFQTWVNTYLDLGKMGFSAEELWEFRNSILHMTNLDSRKVSESKVKRLLFYTAPEGVSYLRENDEGKFFSFRQLLGEMGLAIAKWAGTYNIHRDKFETFLNRYDRIVSDKRMTYIFNRS